MSQSLELWSRFRQYATGCDAVGLTLDVSRMRFPDGLFDRLRGPVRRAFDDMEALEAGAVANPDEKRQVGHYWLRAPHLAPDAQTRSQIEETRKRIDAFAASVREGRIAPPDPRRDTSTPGDVADRFENLLLLGIGGSALGPQLLIDALGEPARARRVYFLDNTDPAGFERVFQAIGDGLRRTLVIVVSKSGGTVETRNALIEAAQRFRQAGLPFARHAVAVTQAGSTLDRQGQEEGWLERFPMWDWVGGRTSVTSAVGLLPAVLLGIDIDAFLAGAAAMDECTRQPDARRNPAALLAQMWHHATDGRGSKDMVVIPYCDRLALFSRYLQQLVMESLGKQNDLDGRCVNQGLTVYGNKGSTDQHAYVQQLREGVANFFVTFIAVRHDGPSPPVEVEPGVTSGDCLHGFLLGTRDALYENGRDSITITLDHLDARSLGGLIALYERAVGLYAGMIRINAYHQPGVEAGKKAAARVLDLQRRLLEELRAHPASARTADELAAAIDSPESAELVYHVLEHLSANPARHLRKTPGPTPFAARYAAG